MKRILFYFAFYEYHSRERHYPIIILGLRVRLYFGQDLQSKRRNDHVLLHRDVGPDIKWWCLFSSIFQSYCLHVLVTPHQKLNDSNRHDNDGMAHLKIGLLFEQTRDTYLLFSSYVHIPISEKGHSQVLRETTPKN